jgi:hypothetical protein
MEIDNLNYLNYIWDGKYETKIYRRRLLVPLEVRRHHPEMTGHFTLKGKVTKKFSSDFVQNIEIIFLIFTKSLSETSIIKHLILFVI